MAESNRKRRGKRKRALVPEYTPCKFFFSNSGCTRPNCKYKHQHFFPAAKRTKGIDIVSYSLEGSDPVQLHIKSLPVKPANHIRVVTCCCTHELHSQVSLPAGDVLFHTGDTCNWRKYYGHLPTREQVWYDFAMNFLRPNREKFPLGMFITFGNHDMFAQENIDEVHSILQSVGCKVLINECATFSFGEAFEDFIAFMSPVSFYRGKPTCAFQVNMRNREEFNPSISYFDDDYIQEFFPKKRMDFLMTHGPPFDGDANLWKGSEAYLKYVLEMKPRYCIFGDGHGGTGRIMHPGIRWENGICFANVALAGTNARFLAKEGLKRGPCVFDIPLRPKT